MSIGSEKPRKGRNAPTGVVIEHHTLARTAIVALLEQELAGWKFIDIVSTKSLDRALGFDVRLITLDLAGRTVGCSSLLNDLADIRKHFSDAPIAVLSDRDDMMTATEVLTLGVQGYFTTSLRIELALAGLRLVLAGGVFCPDPLGAMKNSAAANDQGESERFGRRASQGQLAFTDFTPREGDVLNELRCGSSNKVIAGKLHLSDHTVKMHLQNIMRKMRVQNRTAVVATLGERTRGGNGAAVIEDAAVSATSFRASH